MVERLAGSRVEINASGWAVTSLSPAAGYLPTRYWRGPIWPILNWVLQRGLDRYGRRWRQGSGALVDLSGRAASGSTTVYYRRGAGGGFAWTAGSCSTSSIEMESEKERHGGRRSAPPWTAVPHRATNGEVE